MKIYNMYEIKNVLDFKLLFAYLSLYVGVYIYKVLFDRITSLGMVTKMYFFKN